VMMEPSQLIKLDDRCGSRPDWPKLRAVQVEGLMSPPTMVVAEVLGQDPLEVPLVQHDDVVQAVAANAPAK
jgi:hypothetical protein